MTRIRIPLAVAVFAVLATCGGIDRFGDFAEYPVHAKPELRLQMPQNAPFISQQFFAETAEGNRGHQGIDIWALIGTPILAAAPGTVTISTYEPIYGHQIIIDHGRDENGVPVRTVYKHMKERLVTVGQHVARGEMIGTLGDSGALSALPHLHFEVNRKPRGKWFAEDPHASWMNGPWRVTCFEPGRSYPSMPPFRITYPVACR